MSERNRYNTVAARIRDVPTSCICIWEWNQAKQCFRLKTVKFGCPWHSGGK
jgi:hypothetical protein